jgi:hypothetical protein
MMSSIATAQSLSSSKDCMPILMARDYYSYSEQNNLQLDYLKSIDAETYQQLKSDNKLNFLGLSDDGAIKLDDNYDSFNEIRNKYLNNVHYSRNQQQALAILQETTNPRAYTAYQQCLESLGSGTGSPLRVYAVNEDMDTIELRVKYGGVGRKVLVGTVFGGEVAGAPSGHLWKDGVKFEANVTKPFFIRRARGVSETLVSVNTADGSSEPVTLRFKRADATIALEYDGTVDVLRRKGRTTATVTPNNDMNVGNCDNQVGRDNGRYCISHTTVSMQTTPPFFFRNPSTQCWGHGCDPWTRDGVASISADGLTATTWIDNWSASVQAVIVADEYERMGAKQCGNDGPIPVVKDQAVVFTALKECLSIATVHWVHLPDHSEATFRFGDQGSSDNRIALDSKLDNGTVLLVGYKLVHD